MAAPARRVVEQLAVRGLRNLHDGELWLDPGVNLALGPNGAGKTNLLEALYLALTGRSCRTRNDREAIRFGEPLARAEVSVAGAKGERHAFLTSISHAEGRRRLVDGAAPGRAVDSLRPAVAVFMPDRLDLVKGGPSGRRAHLDGFCAALWPARGEGRRRYGRALAQRNALLARVRGGHAPPDSLDAWEAELAAAGVELAAARREAVALLAAPFTVAAGELGLPGEVGIRLRPRSEATAAAELAAELAECRQLDLSRGYTSTGPHLDELVLERDGRALRRYGSQGQQRLVLLALIFAECDVLVAGGRPLPLLLLDDVTSELDRERRELLCARLTAAGGQALVTATEADQLPRAASRAELVLRDGRPIATAPTPGGRHGAVAA